MNSRSDKYYDDNVTAGSRTQRNAELYKDINKTELENFEIKSNATVIGNSQNNIDVEKIKNILDTHYKDVPKRKSIVIEDSPKAEVKPIFETKEYDINVILDKAKEDKIEDYNIDRSKKLRDTQFDILNNLDMKDYIEDYEEEDNVEEGRTANKDLQRLIDTINLNETMTKKESLVLPDKEENEKTTTDPLDILSELKGSGETAVLDGLQEKTREILAEELESTTGIDKSFFTKSEKFSKKDFEDFEDIEEGSTSIVVKIIIAILALAFIAGIFVLVKLFI